MCFRIHQHALAHDVRPLITYKGVKNNTIVNPYAQPKPCCQQDETIRSWFRCEFGHGCCYLTSRVVKCTKAAGPNPCCQDPVTYHTYEPAQKVVQNNDAPDSTDAGGDKGWYPLETLHEAIGNPILRDQVFRPHEDNVTETMNDVEALKKAFQGLIITFQQIGAVYSSLKRQPRCDTHDTCMRVLNDWECPENQRRQGLKETKARLDRLEQDLDVLQTVLAIRCVEFKAVALA